MHKTLSLLAFAPLALSATGCASLFKGDYSSMRVIGLDARDKVVALDGTEVPHQGELVKLPAKGGTDYVRLSVKTDRGYFTVNPHRYVAAHWAVYDVLGGLVTFFLPVLVDGFTQNWHEYDDVRLPAGPGGQPRPVSSSAAPSTPAAPPRGAAPASEGEPKACVEAREYRQRADEARGEERTLLLNLAERKAGECRREQDQEI